MKNYTQLKQDIENRLSEIGNDLTKQKYPDEVNVLLCNYRTLQNYDKALDPSYCHDGLEISYRLNCVLA